MFTEVNPDKGTETDVALTLPSGITFTEVNPDKGTETSVNSLLLAEFHSVYRS